MRVLVSVALPSGNVTRLHNNPAMEAVWDKAPCSRQSDCMMVWPTDFLLLHQQVATVQAKR